MTQAAAQDIQLSHFNHNLAQRHIIVEWGQHTAPHAHTSCSCANCSIQQPQRPTAAATAPAARSAPPRVRAAMTAALAQAALLLPPDAAPPPPPPPAHVLTFHAVSYDVPIKRGPEAGSTKAVLTGISGAATSGRLLALMGPSGAGKTSLLDILADMPLAGRAGGRVCLNGRPTRKDAAFAQLTSYVQQKDVLVPSATVREALLTSALLKLPRSMSRAAKLARVEELLEQLELSHVAAQLIGDEALGLKGISGGEKRRVSVGIEVVKDPAIIFLDEPTTGLDSEMAAGVMARLAAMARAGKMVIATIHQPNSTICDAFDDWLLLARGRLLYGGPWSGAVPWFKGRGHDCPLYVCPTDFFMNLASNPDTLAALADAYASSQKGKDLLQLESGCDDGTPDVQLCKDVEQGGGAGRGSGALHVSSHRAAGTAGAPVAGGGYWQRCSSSGGSSSHADGRGGGVPMWYAVWVLMLRFFRCWWRTPVQLMSEAAQYLVLGVFMGLLYLRAPPLLPDGPSDRLSSIFLTLTLLAFTPSYTALVVWDGERQLLRREAASGMYSRGAFFVAKSLTTTPVEVAQVSLFTVILYFMFGWQPSLAKFLVALVCLNLFALVSESLGYLVALLTPDSKIGVSVLSVLLVVILSFTGFLVRSVPVYFAWIQSISYFSFATDVLATNEFSGLAFSDPATGASVPGEELLPASMRTGLSIGGNLAVLAGITVGVRLLCWATLELAAWRQML